MIQIKRLVAKLLCNHWTSAVLRLRYPDGVPNWRWPGFCFFVPKNASPESASSIFFGVYESSEIRMIEAGLEPGRDVVELGASLGVVSSHIARKLKAGSKLICVEANPALVPSIETNLSRHARSGVAHQVLNFAITKGEKQVRFHFSDDHTASKRITGEVAAGQVIPARSLSDLLTELNIQDYTLVCDIEGAEIDILLKDRTALARCEAMIMELHETDCDGAFYSVEELKKMIVQDLPFDIVQEDGPVCFFKRRIVSE